MSERNLHPILESAVGNCRRCPARRQAVGLGGARRAQSRLVAGGLQAEGRQVAEPGCLRRLLARHLLVLKACWRRQALAGSTSTGTGLCSSTSAVTLR